MKKPWQIWTAFLLCLIGVVIAMTWLSVQTLQLDAMRETDRIETESARREAELQERISSALYRMDLKLLPLVSLEASRPHYLYQSFYQTTLPTSQTGQMSGGAESPTTQLPSPLLFDPPEFVLLHFEVRPNGKLTSPQRPDDKLLALAVKIFGLDSSTIEKAKQRLAEVTSFCNYEILHTTCPSQELAQDTRVAQKGMPLPLSQSQSYFVPAIDNIVSNIIERKGFGVKDDSKSNSRKSVGGKVAIQQSRGQSRVNADFNKRRDSTRNFANQQAQSVLDNSFGNGNYGLGNGIPAGRINLNSVFPAGTPFEDTVVQQGVMQPVWIDGNLVLVRIIEGRGKPFFQCCWLDWEAIQVALREEVADILPVVEFDPIKIDTELNLGTALTTIPVQLVIDSSRLLSTLSIDSASIPVGETSGLKMALIVAWCGLAFAALASVLLFHGVLKLSERRATFVSAVTHELRTPLTTFRMYAEMLAEGMVPLNKEQEYTNTLRVQADRLSHLVENVLQFARLERNSAKISNETVTVGELVPRFESRLRERARECNLELSVGYDESVVDLRIETQPSNIEQVLFNLVDNACKYGRPSSENRIEITCTRKPNKVLFLVRDFGPGINLKNKNKMFQPFHKSDLDAANSAPGVGLGLALCRRMAKSLGGRLFHESRDPGAVFILEIPI